MLYYSLVDYDQSHGEKMHISPLHASASNSMLTRTCAPFIIRITHIHLRKIKEKEIRVEIRWVRWKIMFIYVETWWVRWTHGQSDIYGCWEFTSETFMLDRGQRCSLCPTIRWGFWPALTLIG